MSDPHHDRWRQLADPHKRHTGISSLHAACTRVSSAPGATQQVLPSLLHGLLLGGICGTLLFCCALCCGDMAGQGASPSERKRRD